MPRDPDPQQDDRKEKDKNSKVALIVVIIAVVCVIGLLVVYAFYMHWFGLDFHKLFGGAETTTVTEAVEQPGTAETTVVAPTAPTIVVTEEAAQPVGSPQNPIPVNTAKYNVPGQIGTPNGECVYAFRPDVTGYYYIQIPDAGKTVQFKVYNGSTNNLMGVSEYQTSGKQMLFYNMFFSGNTYLVYVTSSQAKAIAASFVDHTNDKIRRIQSGDSLKMNAPYTYLRKFTPSESGTYLVTAAVDNELGKLKLYDKDWNPIQFQLYVDDESYEQTYYFFTMRFQAGTEYNFVVTPADKLTFAVAEQ